MAAGNLIDLRRRVRSVKNIQQITRAMKFISASRLKKAQDRAFSARPYATRMLAVLNSLATRVDSTTHPLLSERNEKKTMLVVITSDKGLCGSFNSSIIKGATNKIESEAGNKELSLALVGRKGYDWFKRRSWPIRHHYVNIMAKVDPKYARELALSLIKYYEDEEIDSVQLVYNEFKSVVQQNLVVEPLLPIRKLELESEQDTLLEYLYEQPPELLLGSLLPKHVETQILRAMLESEAAEQAARMTAMDSATRNAKEMIASLTLKMNRIRQAAITTEIIEIVSGADALQEDQH